MDPTAKQFAGKVSLYQTLDNLASRPYLRRNLRDVLDSHERELLGESNASGETQDDQNESQLPSEWEPPSDRMMEHLFEYQKPTLRIRSLHLRDPSQGPRPPRSDAEPSWLPQPDEFISSCQVVVIVMDPRNGARPHNNIRQARVVARDNSKDGNNNSNNKMTYEILLEKPFNIDIDQLSCTTPGYTDKGPWARQLDEGCTLEISIQFQDSEASAEFLSQVEGRPLKEYFTSAANEGIVKAKWSKLPDLPKDGELLPLKRSKGHKSLDLRYKVEVDMGWNERTHPLTRHSRALRQRRDQLRQLPTPVSDDLEAGRSKCTVKYLFLQAGFEVRSVVTNDLKCIFCRHDWEHSSFDRLRLHYTMNHEHFEFDVDERSKDLKIIRIKHADDQRVALGTVSEWEAPDGPFDAKAYFNGDSSWMDEGWEKGRKDKSGGKNAIGKSPNGKSAPRQKQGIKIDNPKKKLTAPEEVPDLAPHERKRHMVPNVPGVEFYRTYSKQKLKPGDYISDSDDDLDDTWMKQSQRRDLKQLGEDGISLDFNELFNRHLDEEQPMSDTLTADALVRFARKFKDKLKEPKWMENFEAKLAQLESKRIIRKETAAYCIDLVEAAERSAARKRKRSTSPLQSGESGAAAPGVLGVKPAAPIDDTGVLTAEAANAGKMNGVPHKAAAAAKKEEAPAPTKGPQPMKPCICGEMIQRQKGTIACANVTCKTYGFHMTCVGMQPRQPRPQGWKCPECSSS